MAYIEVHQSLRDHRKILALAAELDMPEPHVAGHCLYLWLWSLDNAEDGVLPASERIVERAACWQGMPGAFVTGMVCAGMLDRDEDGSLHIHDWWEYAGRFIEKRRQNADRMRSARASSSRGLGEGRATHVQPTFDARAGATEPYRTEPNRTVPNRNVPPSEGGDSLRDGEESIFVAADAAPPDSARSPGCAGSLASPVMTGSLPADEKPWSNPREKRREERPPVAANLKPRALKPVFAEDSPPMQLAQYHAAGIRAHKPDAKIPKTPKDLQSWAREFDLMLRIDKRPRDAITAVIDYATTNTFWRRVVFSADKLRQKFDTLDCQRQDDGGNGNGPVLGNRRGHAGRERPSAGSPSGPPNVRRFTEEWYAERERVHNARGLGSSSAADRARSTAQATG